MSLNSEIKVYIDGASRNNPGHSGAGIYLIKDETVLVQKGFYLGVKTNNQAEYLAFLLAIFYAKQYMQKSDKLVIISDSQLLVRQISGIYSVKNSELKKMFDCAINLLKDYNYQILHVLREHNKIADKLANHGIDKRAPLPPEFLEYWCLDESK